MALNLYLYTNFYILHDTKTDNYWSGARDVVWFYLPNPAPRVKQPITLSAPPITLTEIDHELIKGRGIGTNQTRIAPYPQRTYTEYVWTHDRRNLFRILRTGVFVSEVEVYLNDKWQEVFIYTERLTDTTPAEQIDWIEMKLLH